MRPPKSSRATGLTGTGQRRTRFAAAHFFVAAIGMALTLVSVGAPAGQSTTANGEAMYRRGILPSGAPLRGTRENTAPAIGAGAACANCHRRSGLGVTESRVIIPAITAKYLFRPGERPTPEGVADGATYTRERYTDDTLARAIAKGLGPQGQPLSVLMPRFDLDPSEMSALVAYLHQLSSGVVPGVGPETLDFATIITPDADPIARQGMLDVLTHFFASKTRYYRGEAPPLRSARKLNFRVLRKWQLHVWELQGSASTWEQQLRHKLHGEPVFAVISGVGGANWAPVHQFCEHESLPCLLPNVDLPIVADKDRGYYSIYYSRGVLLEASLIAQRLPSATSAPAAKRIIQVYRDGDIGEAAAHALATSLAQSGSPPLVNRPVFGAGSGALAAAVRDVNANDSLVLWLRPRDLKSLPEQTQAASVWLSGLMAGLEQAPVPTAWRPLVRMTYLFDLPQARRVRMAYPLDWFGIQRIPVVDERTQVNTYLACVMLSEALGHMRDDFVRDYLLEQFENNLSFRVINGYYPRLGLGPGQRFASKGGYLVRFADTSAGGLVADGDWMVPGRE